MKYIIIVGDGMADYPIAELENKTPLQAADTPNMDLMARNGISGMVNTIPEMLEMSLVVYDLVKAGEDLISKLINNMI